MRHPVTGEPRIVTLDGMLDRGIAEAVSLCRIICDVVGSGDSLPADLHGPSLELGFRGMPAREMAVFASPPPGWVD